MEKIYDQVPLLAYPTFVPSAPITVIDGTISLDFKLTISNPTAVRVLWYFEFCEDNPYDPNTEWFTELAEEDVGNGDVRMPPAIRRFSTYSTDADYSDGTYLKCAQFKRAHKFARLQMAGLGCTVTAWSVFDGRPLQP